MYGRARTRRPGQVRPEVCASIFRCIGVSRGIQRGAPPLWLLPACTVGSMLALWTWGE